MVQEYFFEKADRLVHCFLPRTVAPKRAVMAYHVTVKRAHQELREALPRMVPLHYLGRINIVLQDQTLDQIKNDTDLFNMLWVWGNESQVQTLLDFCSQCLPDSGLHTPPVHKDSRTKDRRKQASSLQNSNHSNAQLM